MIKNILVIGLLLISAGCATRYPVTIASNPRGAEVFCDGQSFGYAPITRYYELNEATKNYGKLRTCSWELQWVSGATATADNIYDLKRYPNGIVWTVQRPLTEPNGYLDHQFALQLMESAQRAAQRSSDSDDRFIEGLSRTLAPPPPAAARYPGGLGNSVDCDVKDKGFGRTSVTCY